MPHWFATGQWAGQRGDFGYVPERLIRTYVRYRSEAEQRRLLEEHAQTAKSTGQPQAERKLRRIGRQKISLRLVAYFNPQMFVEQRALALERRQRIEDFLDDLNRRLRSPHSNRDKETIQVEVSNKLAGYNLLKTYHIKVKSVKDAESGRTYWQVRSKFNKEEWQNRQRHAGFVLLVGHPELPHTAQEIVKLYRERIPLKKISRL